jgi:hypothetical protein
MMGIMPTAVGMPTPISVWAAVDLGTNDAFLDTMPLLLRGYVTGQN